MNIYHRSLIVSLLCVTWVSGNAAGPRYERAEVSPDDVKELQKGRESTEPQPLKNERPITPENPPKQVHPAPEPIKPEDPPPQLHPTPQPAPDMVQRPLKADPIEGVQAPQK